MLPIAVTPPRFWSDSPRTPSGASGNQKKAMPSTPLPMSRKKCWPRPPGQLERLDQLHAELVLVPRDGLGHVATDEREVVEPAELELGVGVLPGRGHGRVPSVDSSHCTPSSAGGQASPRFERRTCEAPAMFRIQPACHDSSRSPAPTPKLPIVLSMYKRLFGDRDPVAEPGTATGTPGDWWTVFANSPDVLEHASRGFALYASPERKISARAARAGPDPRRLVGRQPVRVLAALQVVPRATASPRRRSRRSRRGASPTCSLRSSGRCSRTPTRWCRGSAGSTTPCSTRCAST